ncbi:MAG: glutathione-dependent formaldehyde-activating protein [SAR116 cluster bacterium]|nr:glutathione-dependent formaldehyde-activating protein [SAR116 cluster bacterium]
MSSPEHHTGGCHCGGVRYVAHGALRPILICHCHDCMKIIGTSIAATSAPMANVEITGDSLKWYQSSDIAERGFCDICGASLFYKPLYHQHISITAGTLDDASVLTCGGQIFAHDHPGFMPIPDDVPHIDEKYKAFKNKT